MNEEDAEEFFDHLEAPLKETFKIPKRKASSESSTTLSSPLLKVQTPSEPKIGYGDQNKRWKNTHTSISYGKEAKKQKRTKKESVPAIEESKPQEDSKSSETPKHFAQAKVQEQYLGTLPEEVFEQCSGTYCGLCQLEMTSESTALSHYLGRPHLKEVDAFLNKLYLKSETPVTSIPRRLSKTKVLKKEIKSGEFISHCEICNVDLSSPIVSLSHFQGQRHLKALKKAECPQPKEEDPQENNGRISSGGPFFCKVCQVDLKSSVTLTEHLAGKPHMNKVKNVNNLQSTASSLFCKICSLVAPNESAFQAHCNGKKHLRKVLLSK